MARPAKPSSKDVPPNAGKSKRTAAPARRRRTIPVHALADERTHLALGQMGRLRQGTLKTLCGLQVVSALSPFVLAEKTRKRCPACFRQVDGEFFVTR